MSEVEPESIPGGGIAVSRPGKSEQAGDDQVMRFSEGGVKWMVRKDWYDVLAPDFFRRLSLQGEIQGSRVIKENRVRKVLKIQNAGPDGRGLFIKCYAHQGKGDALKNLFIPSRARKEWRVSLALREKEIPTSAGIGYGEGRRSGILKTSFYLTEAIEGAQDLQEWWTSSSPAGRHKMIDRLALLLRNLHRQRFFPSDLHPGNLIVGQKGNGEFSLHMVDLHSVRRVLKLKKKRRLRNLVQLNDVAYDLPMMDKLRFFRGYAGAKDILEEGLCGENGKIQELTIRYRDRQFRRRLKRCLKGKYVYGKWRGDGFVIYHRLDFDHEKAFQAVFDYREAPHRDGISFIKTEHDHTILTLPLRSGKVEGAPEKAAARICLKHYRPRGFLYSLKDLLRTHRGRRSWVAGNALFLKEAPTCRPLALVEMRKGGFLKESFLLMEDLSTLSAIHKYVLDNFHNNLSETSQTRLHFMEALADSLLGLHRMDIYHGDLKSSNILVEEADGGWKFHYIDLDAVKLGKKVSLKRRAKNLAQIETSTPPCITDTERKRFFEHYLDSANEIADGKAFLNMVVSQASKRERIW